VQLYGTLDVGIGRYDNGTNTQTGMFDSGWYTSKIGVKGSEDLGGGLAAIFQGEWGFNPSTNTGLSSGRDTFVGLQGGFGTMTMGRISTFTDGLVGTYDLLGGNASVGGVGNISPDLDPNSRNNTVLSYVSPSFAGVGLGAQYIFANGQGAGYTQTTGGYNLMAGYNNGPISVGAAYLRRNLAASVGGGAEYKNSLIGASYDFGVAKVAGMYVYNNLTATDNKYKAFNIGVSVPFGASTVMATYSQGKYDNAKNALTTGTGKAKQISLGYTYSLSKRTTLYGVYSHISNSDGSFAMASSGVTGLGLTGIAGQNSSGFNVGVAHTF
jgi:predicted porin